ncbi:MAG: ABC transporter ATP-binding protein [Thermomicrobiales bacterium]
MAQTVTIEHVSRAFGTGVAPVLAQVDLTIPAGEFVALLGASGCGKSTLLRLVAGLDAPTAGRVSIGGVPVSGVDPRCSIVFQEPRLLPWRTVTGNVELGARRAAGAFSPAEMLERVGLSGYGSAWPHQLSGGMAQRAALARALVGAPGVLLLDEPFAALDALTRLRMQDLLVEACGDDPPTVIMVTHDVDEAIRMADRIVILGGSPAGVRVSQRVSDWSEAGALDALRADILHQFGLGAGRANHHDHPPAHHHDQSQEAAFA